MVETNGIHIQSGVQIIPFGKKSGPFQHFKKQSQQLQQDSFESIEYQIEPPYDLAILSDLYVENTWNYRCVNVKADLVCSGIRIKPVEEDKQIDTNSPNYKRLRGFIQHPNHGSETLKDILRRFWIDVESLGNAYLEIDRNRKGELNNLYHLPAYTVRKARQSPGYWQIRDQRQQYFNAFGAGFEQGRNELLHYKSYYQKSDYYGIPDFLPALFAALLDKNALEFNYHFFDNGLLLSMAIISKGFKYDSASQQAIQKFFRERGRGLKNAHGVLYLPINDPDPNKDIKFERLMSEVAEGSFRELRRDIRDEIIAAHGVLPRLVGVVTPNALGGQSEGFSQMKTFKMTIDDKKETLAHIINRILQESFHIDDLEITFGKLDITNKKEDAAFVKAMREIDLLTEDEGRSEINYAPKTAKQKEQKNLHDILKAVKGLKEILEKQM